MGLIVMIDTQIGTLYSLMYVYAPCWSIISICLIHIYMHLSSVIAKPNSQLKTDQHERLRWFTRTHICRNWMCFQKASTLWI